MGDGLATIGRWLALVAAITLGVFLGLLLYVEFLKSEIRDAFSDAFNSTPSYSTPTTTPDDYPTLTTAYPMPPATREYQPRTPYPTSWPTPTP
ncbi:hypothetical protein [Mycolicibacterium novocastrense]|uniref:hypothetical protein n=1 Tax=Mycolicibacterium novocastrense TaxID=59813 RepID=UPI0008377694|nr:hypothetical protein [Mycolicibacterium novocastrense]